MTDLLLRPIGVIRSSLTRREDAPRQGFLGGVEAWLELNDGMEPAIDGLVAGMDLVLLTWLHLSRRDQLRARSRRQPELPETGVLSTRSPERPNPIGLHKVQLLKIAGLRLKVGPLEALDGTPLLDIKPALTEADGQ